MSPAPSHPHVEANRSTGGQSIWALLPAHLRARDEQAGGVLRALVAVVAEQVAAMEAHLDRLLDDQFIETCDAEMVPFIGALLGWSPLPDAGTSGADARAEVANLVAARRRKGTAAMLEQVARDVSGWPAHLIECFQHLATTQHLNHLRTERPATLDLRRALALERLHGPFGAGLRTAELRPVDAAAPRWSVPHVAVAVWPFEAVPVTRVLAARVDAGRHRFDPLGADRCLMARPDAEADVLGLAAPRHVPRIISRLELEADLAAALAPSLATSPAGAGLVGPGRSIEVWLDGVPVEPARVRSCHLGNLGADDAAGWAHQPGDDLVAIDPVLGRLALRPDTTVAEVRVTWHRALPARLGGGEYERRSAVSSGLEPVEAADASRSLDDALDAIGARAPGGGRGRVSLRGPAVQALSGEVVVAADSTVALHAADGHWPLVELGAGVDVRFVGDGELLLEGLLLRGGALRVVGDGSGRRVLRLRHCTMVPGQGLRPDGSAVDPGRPSIVVQGAGVEVVLEQSIVGPLRLHEDAEVRAEDSIIDAGQPDVPALCAEDGMGPAGPATLSGCTVIGAIHVTLARLISNAILLAGTPSGWTAPVRAVRRQAGCVRHSWLPPESVVPRRHRCLPTEDQPARPRHLSLRYGHPGYAMLHPACPPAIRRNADDEDEMGAMHQARRRRRLANAAIRIDEHLRAGFAAGLVEVVPRGGEPKLDPAQDRLTDAGLRG